MRSKNSLFIVVLAFVLAIQSMGWLSNSPTDGASPGIRLAGLRSALADDTTELVLYYDYNGYKGVQDTYMTKEEPTTTHGSEQKLHAKESSWGTKRMLIRFELSQVPHYVEIVDAFLELYVTERYPANSTALRAYPLLKNWDEAGATWTTPGGGQTWAMEGAASPGIDYDASMTFGSMSITRNETFVRLNVVDIVREWVLDPTSNRGLVILSTNSVDVRFWSSQGPIEARRPRLTVIYRIPPDVTPEPTFTPTMTLTPTPGPTATPTPANIIRSYGLKDSQGWECIETFAGAPATTEVLLVWQGQATYAKLIFYHHNNYPEGDHHVLVNGTRVGTLSGVNGSGKCGDIGLATKSEFSFDPSLLRNGLNEITAVCDAKDTSGWSMSDPVIEVGGQVRTAEYNILYVPSSYDQTTQRATIQKPIGYTPEIPFPLVIALHGWGAKDYDALKWVAEAANERGWLLACPWIRGGSEHTASKAVQHDIIDLIDYLINNPDYNIDTSRIYIMGRSMGGMIAATTAAKYPDRFAGLAEQAGPSDLASWYSHLCSMPDYAYHCSRIADELNGTPNTVPFDYQRRSAATMPMNLRYVPTLIIHGTTDQVVPYAHGENLYQGLLDYGSQNVVFAPFEGGHQDSHPNWGAGEILDFLGGYTLETRPLTMTIRTDEQKSYYWLKLAYNDYDHWTLFDASFDPRAQIMRLAVRDGRARPVALDLTVNLITLGLPTNTAYTVEEVNASTGAFRQYPAEAGATSLLLHVGRDHYDLTAYPYSAPEIHNETLRQGEGDYAGVFDTHIDGYVPNGNYAADPLRLTGGTYRTPLLRFDLSHIPTNADVKAAQLGLYAYFASPSGAKVSSALYKVLQPWDVSTVTWQKRSATEFWQKAGALEGDVDYQTNAYALIYELSAVSTWYRYNVTDMVRAWVRDPGSNHGLLVRGIGGSGTISLNSSESPMNKPELIVVWAEPTAMPTPTITPTPTATATPTTLPRVPAYLPMVYKP